MHTIPISFCSGIAFHITDDLAKEEILRDVSDRMRIRTMIRDAKYYTPDSGFDTTGAYVVHLQSRGNPYLLFLTRLGFCETAMYVDRKVRKGYRLPRIIVDHVMFEPDLFAGTVISGEMVCTADAEWRFLAEDLLAIRGRPIGRAPFRDRYSALVQVVASHRCDDASTHKILVKKMFEASADGMARMRQHAESVPYPCTGHVFRSLIPGKSNWFVREPAQPATIKTMRLRATVTPDVYDVVDPSTGKPCGNLGVPGIEVSRELSSRVCESGAVRKWTCRWSPVFNKWMAIADGGTE